MRLAPRALLGLALVGALSAQNQAPTVNATPRMITARPNMGPVTLFLADVFRDPDLLEIKGTQVRFETTLGAVNIELFDRTAPRTVTNFLRYVNSGRYSDVIWHRVTDSAVPFVQTIDTGSRRFSLGSFPPVSTFDPIANEFGASNLRGTVAMNRPTGSPDGATSSWFINRGDNHVILDTFEGGFTVFGRVIEGGMTVVDTIFAVPVFNRGGDLTRVPLRNYTSGTPTASNVISLGAGTVAPKLVIRATSSNPALVNLSSPATVEFSAGLFIGNNLGAEQITLTATDFNGATAQTSFNVTVSANPPQTNLANIATRARVGTGENVLIGGFVVRDNAKRVLVRALGPSLAGFGVAGALSDPSIDLRSGGASVASNDNWRSAQEADIQATGFAPSNNLDSALIATLPPGSYTPIVSGVSGATGVAIVEVYELAVNEAPRLVNLSSRGRVGVGDDVMIGGFVIEGTTPKRVLIRAAGPSLTPFGVTGALADPQLELFTGSLLITSNDDWRLDTGGPNPDLAAIMNSGFAPSNDAESAIIRTLAPGSYTAVVRGANASQGVAIIEVYDLD